MPVMRPQMLISPQLLCHPFVTATLRDVQIAARHADDKRATLPS